MKDFVITKIEDIVDKERKIKHSKLTELTEDAITEPSKIGIKLKAENVDIAYQPIFQSGGGRLCTHMHAAHTCMQHVAAGGSAVLGNAVACSGCAAG